MTVKGRMPRKPKRCAARTHHMSVTQPIMAMGMAMPGMMPAVSDSFRMMTVNGTPTTNDHANMRSVSCSCQDGSSRQPSPVCAHTGPQVGAADLHVSFPPAACCRRGVARMGWLLSLAALSGEQRSETRLVSGTRMMEHTHAEQCSSAPSGAQPSPGKAAQFRTHRGSHRAFQLKQTCSCDGPTTTALKVAISCYALCTTTLCTANLQGNSTRAHKGTC